MLNELKIIARGAAAANISMVQCHPDIKGARAMPTLGVQLGSTGDVVGLRCVSDPNLIWTLRDGQHNSFPFVQPKRPLLLMPDAERERKELFDRRNAAKRLQVLQESIDRGAADPAAAEGWTGPGFFKRISERRSGLALLSGGTGGVVLGAMDRFLLAASPAAGGNPARLIAGIVAHLAKTLSTAAESHWAELALVLLIGKRNAKKGGFECMGALVIDASGYPESILDDGVKAAVSDALVAGTNRDKAVVRGICAMEGTAASIITDSFPQPNVAVLGQTYLFAKNSDIPANKRYDRTAAAAFAVGRDTAMRLAAAFESLTSDDRESVTWQSLPSPTSVQRDLLLAFVHGDLRSSVLPLLIQAENGSSKDESEAEDDESELSVEQIAAKRVGQYELRTQRVIEAFKARLSPLSTQVDIVVFRKIDPANRKVVLTENTSIGALSAGAQRWVDGERNFPSWIRLPLYSKKLGKPIPTPPLHVDPLGLIIFSRSTFLGGGTYRKEINGIAPAEALAFFLDDPSKPESPAAVRARRLLRLVLARRAALLAGVAHARRRKVDIVKKFDCREALHTVRVLGNILDRVSHSLLRERVMESNAFRFGQILAAVDELHAGYCADVRGGELPPTLLGNQIFAIAQRAPKRAMVVLGQRLSPYSAWAKRAVRHRARIDRLAESKDALEKQRGWDIRRALRCQREIEPIARMLDQYVLTLGLEDPDVFHAQLVLGYLAGIPPREDDVGDVTSTAEQ
jgi:hypothetical protein